MVSHYEPVIGLEVHAQLLTRTKLFCACRVEAEAPANSRVCPVCLGLPGALPVCNRAAVMLALRVGLALDCEVRLTSVFARKNYFYPDLPKGYQITQYEMPLLAHGRLEIDVEGIRREIEIDRIHIEEDAAKSSHGVGGTTLVDCNRAGTPLVEIVSAPAMHEPEEAEGYLRNLREVLMFAGVNDGNLEQGSFRCDANVSIRPRGDATLGTRVEIKNINSFRFVRKALEYEIERQRTLLSEGRSVAQETRTYDDVRDATLPMRDKEGEHDYRYFPDPDLPPLRLSAEDVETARSALGESAREKRRRFREDRRLDDDMVGVLASHPGLAAFFDAAVVALQDLAASGDAQEQARTVAKFLTSEVLRHARTDGLSFHSPIDPQALAELLAAIDDGTISRKAAKSVLAHMVGSGASAAASIAALGVQQVSDAEALAATVRTVLDQHRPQVAAYRAGQQKLLGFFVGQIMKATRGAANPQAVNEILTRMLAEEPPSP